MMAMREDVAIEVQRILPARTVYTMLSVVVALAIGYLNVWNDNRALYQRMHNAETTIKSLKAEVELSRSLDDVRASQIEIHKLLVSIAAAEGINVRED